MVDHFLAGHPEFARAPAGGADDPPLVCLPGDFQTLPRRHGVDGAYAARLTRLT